MANPNKSDSQLATSDNKPMISSQQAFVADVATTGATSSSPYGYTTAAQADDILTKINLILDVLEAHGLMADA
jgi:hypothetical protein